MRRAPPSERLTPDGRSSRQSRIDAQTDSSQNRVPVAHPPTTADGRFAGRQARATALVGRSVDRYGFGEGERPPYLLAWDALAHLEYRFGFARRFEDSTNAIILYHSVGDPGALDSLPVEQFERQVAYLDDRYEIVDLPAVLEDDAGSASTKRIALTFDDGFGNFYRNAVPVLERYDAPATVFVTAGFVDGAAPGRIKSVHRRDTVGPETMLTEEQLGELAANGLVTIGNHTQTHPNLETLDSGDDLEREIVGAQEALESRFGISVDRFSYPFGSATAESVRVVEQSHDYAVTTRQGLVTPADSPHRLPRIMAHASDALTRWDLTDLRWRLASLAPVTP